MNQELITAVEAIKTAILQSQYQAAKETTRVQLILYYGIGRYLSSKKGKETWGTLEDSNSSVMTDEFPDKTNSSVVSDELTSIIPIADFKLSGINLSDFPWELQLTNLFLKCRKRCRKFCQIWMILRRLCRGK